MNRTAASAHITHFGLSHEPAGHMIGAIRVAAVALLAAVIDLAACVIYWQAQGIGLASILRAIAGWVLGPNPPATAPVLAIGFAVEYLIYLSMGVVVRHALARVGNGSIKHRMAVGFGCGIIIYTIVYQVLVPALIFPRSLYESPAWIATCVLLHGIILGPLMAWLLADFANAHEEQAS